MPVQIEIETNITLTELVMLKQNGYMVEATPHIGNMPVRSLALMSLGIRPNLVDITIGEKDNLFYPHCIIKDGNRTEIAPGHLMTTHNKIDGTNTSLTDFHTEPLKKMGLPFLSHSDWVESNQKLVFNVCQVVVENFSYLLWGKYVESDGSIKTRHVETQQVLNKIHKVTSPKDQAGWVIPNPVNILLDLVNGAQETQKDVIYMLSGQSMYKYIHKGYRMFGPMDELISAMYDKVRDCKFTNLPKLLTVKMVPTPVIRDFVAPTKFKDRLDRKLRHYKKLETGISRCGKKMSEKTLSLEKMTALRSKRKKLFGNISEPLSLICANSETGKFYSQHDLYKDQDTIYIPDQVMNMRILEMMVKAQKMSNLAHVPAN